MDRRAGGGSYNLVVAKEKYGVVLVSNRKGTSCRYSETDDFGGELDYKATVLHDPFLSLVMEQPKHTNDAQVPVLTLRERLQFILFVGLRESSSSGYLVCRARIHDISQHSR